MMLNTQSLARVEPQRPLPGLLGFVLAASLLASATPTARGGSFTANFNTDPSSILNFGGTLWDGSSVTRTGSANWQNSGGAGPMGGTTNGPVKGVANDGFLQLTMAGVGGTRTSYLCGGVLFDDFDHGLVVAGFTFECDLRIGNGNPNPADGFSISYCRTNDPVLLALLAGDTFPQMNNVASPNGGRFADNGGSGDPSLMEEGTLTGLAIGFDMWDSNNIGTTSPYGKVATGIIHDGIGLDIRVDGVLQTVISMPNGTTQGRNQDSYTGAGITPTDTNGNNGGTDPTAIETGPYDGSNSDANLNWVHMKVDLATSGILNVYWKNKQILTNFQTSYFPSPGRLLMAARVGGNTANIEVDNIQITTIPASGPVLTKVNATPSYLDLALLDQAGITVNTNKSISLVVDGGAAVAPTSIVYTNNTTTLHFANPANVYYRMNSTHGFNLAFTDSNGSSIKNSNKSFTVAGYPFEAVSPQNYAIEGTDFNFGGGQFIDNVVLSAAAGPNNYLDKVGTPNIDEYDPAENGAAHNYRAYDSATSTGEIVGTEPVGTGELALRSAPGQKYDPAKTGDPAVVAYDVGWVDVGEWYNYTRTFPAGKYKIYARLANGTAGNFVAQIDQVASGATTTTQTLVPLGRIPGIPTGGWQNYQFFPLVDGFGNELVLPIGGKQTMRFTTLSGGLNVEYFSFVPVPNAGTLTPYALNVTPTPGAIGVNPAVAVSATIANLETSVKASTITLAVNGASVTPTVTTTPNGAIVTYTPATLFSLGSTNKVQLVFSDDAATPHSISNQWSFVIIPAASVPFTMPVAYAKPADSGQTPGFSVRVLQSDASSPNTTAWSEAMLHAQYNVIAGGFDTPQVINYYGSLNGTGGGHGHFGNDRDFDATFNLANGNNFALEAVTYLALSPGVYTFGVNSDDGFRVTTGNYAQDLVTMSGAEYNGGRGPGDTTWKFLVQTNGLYPFRLTYEEGGGGYEVEWWSIDDNGAYHLIGDPNDPKAIKAYRYSSALPANPITFTQPLTNMTVEANTTVTFSANATSTVAKPSTELFEWFKDGQHLLYGPGFTIPFVQASDAGNYQCSITLLGYQSQVTKTATAKLTVTPDVTPPVMVSAVGSAGLGEVDVLFSEPLDPTSAAAAANYSLSPGATVTAATLGTAASGQGVVALTVTGLKAGTAYTLAINNVKDNAGNSIVAGSKLNLTAASASLDFSGGFGPAAATLQGNATFLGTGGFNNNGTLQLTPAVNSQSGSVFIPDLDAGKPVYGFQANFRLFLGNATSPPADGLAFSWGSDVTAVANNDEEGHGNGLIVEFDTYQNNSSDLIGIDVKYGGSEIVTNPVNTAAVTSASTRSTALVKNQWVDVSIGVYGNGELYVSYDGGLVYHKLMLPGFQPISAGNFLIGARTGGLNEQCLINNLTITTFQQATPRPASLPLPNITLQLQQPGGQDWNSTGFWSDGKGASTSAALYPGVGYELLPGSRLRSPSSGAAANSATFPGASLILDGDGTLIPQAPAATPTAAPSTVSEIRFKGNDKGTVYFTNLIANGGQLNMGNAGTAVIQGKLTVQRDLSFYTDISSDTPDDRGFQIDAQLAGTGTISFYHDNMYLTNGPYLASKWTRDLNITGTANTFAGKWNVAFGALLGSGAGSLGTNDITVTANGVLETLYDVNNPSGSLILNGLMYLHQNDTFGKVIVNGTALAAGKYTFAQLTAAYPNNFPATWNAINGSTVTAGSGSITVVGGAPPVTAGPQLVITKSGGNVTITWPTTAGLTLKQTGSLSAPISWSPVSQTPTASGGNSSVTLPIGAGNQFFQLRQ